MQGQMDAKLKLLVEAPAAVEDALASLLNHVDSEVQVSLAHRYRQLSLGIFTRSAVSVAWFACIL